MPILTSKLQTPIKYIYYLLQMNQFKTRHVHPFKDSSIHNQKINICIVKCAPWAYIYLKDINL